MLSSIKSRRILNILSVSLALMMFGYGIFLKYDNRESLISEGGAPLMEVAETFKDSVYVDPFELNISEPD